MSRRRPSREGEKKQSPRKHRRERAQRMITRHMAEALEERRMLTTLTAAAGVHDTFDFFTPIGTVVRIAYSGVTFEAIGVALDSTTGTPFVENLFQETFRGQTAPTPTGSTVPNLFTLYVTQSDINSYISIAELTQPAATDPGIEAMEPFSSPPSVNVEVPATGLGLNFSYSAPTGSGAAVLGQLSISTAANTFPPANTPIDSITDPGAVGIYPGGVYGDGLLHAGLYVANNATTGLPQDLGKFFFGGLVFGQVHVGGNMQVFYAGDILTGTGEGVLQTRSPLSASDEAVNFSIGGDIQDLITNGDIGGSSTTSGGSPNNPNYETGFDAVIGGKIGEIYQKQGDFLGALHVEHNPSIVGLTDTTPDQELEFKDTDVYIIGDPGGIGQIFEGANGYLTDLNGPHLPDPFFNDTSDLAQYLGSTQEVNGSGALVTDVDGRPVYHSVVEGLLQNQPPINFPTADPADWYAVSLLAGQQVTVNLLIGSLTNGSSNTGDATVLVQDPDGRTIFSDAPLHGATPATGTGFQFTPDRPGIYRFEIRQEVENANIPYTLEISGTGDMALGEMVVAGEIHDTGLNSALTFDRGDVGAIEAGTYFLSDTSGPTTVSGVITAVAPTSVLVADGDLRALVAASIGFLSTPAATNQGAIFTEIPYLDVPLGNLGLVQATDPAGILAIQTRFYPITLATPLTHTPESPIGKSIQTIAGAGSVYLQIAGDAGIGTIDAGNMATHPASFIEVNADNAGNDGIIDLIDCTGDFGAIDGGGPGFVTNTGGNIRYIEVGGTIFKDAFFGGNEIGATQYGMGQSAALTDDSGTTMTIAPVGPVVTTTVTNADGTTSTTTTGPQITLTTYPVRDKAGVVVINAVSTGSISVTASGGARGAAATAEISRLELQGVGIPITASGADAFGNTTLVQAAPTVTSTSSNDLSALISGSATVDIFNVVVTLTSGSTTVNGAVSITNNTPGEIVNVNAPNIGTLSARGTIGLAKHHTAAEIAPSEVLAAGSVYPFVQQHFGVQVTGSILSVSAGGGVGNFAVGDTTSLTTPPSTAPAATDGTIQFLSAGTRAVPNEFAGINGPILAIRILSVNIGQGILPTGTGTVGLAGLYAIGNIGVVTGVNAAIRGNIVADEVDATNTGINQISLFNTSIIGARIYCVSQLIMSSDNPPNGVTVPVLNRPVNGTASNEFDIGSINVQGNGGIIGTDILAANIGPTTVGPHGFGIFNTSISTLSIGRIATVTAGGYGIRGCSIGAGSYVDGLNATGNGNEISVRNFSQDVRESESGQFDPFFGYAPSSVTDLDAYLGTSLTTPIINGVTDSGVIEDTQAVGNRDLGFVSAQQIRVSTPVGTTLNIPVIGQTYASSFNFGDAINRVTVRGPIDGLQITTGRIGTFRQNNSVSRLGISVAGTIDKLMIHGNFGQTITDPNTQLPIPDSYIQATGPNGIINNLSVTGNLNGNVTALSSIGKMTVNGSVVGNISALGNTTGYTLQSLHIGGSLRDGSLTVDGSAGDIITNGALGDASGTLTINGNLKSLTVGAAHGAGHNLNAALNVNANLGKLTVYGQINGAVTVGGNLTSLRVIDTGNPGSVIAAPINIAGSLGTALITDGPIGANIITNGDIGSFTAVRASLLPNTDIESNLGSISKFQSTGGAAYGVFGSLLAANGRNENIDIGGNLGDGADLSTITADQGNIFRVRGSIFANASITVASSLGLLQVDGNINAGATVTAHPLVKLKVIGTNAGLISGI